MLLNQKAALHSSGAFLPSDSFKVISLRVVRWRNYITTEYKYYCFEIPRVPDGFVGFEVVWNFTSKASFESGNHVKGTIKEVMMQSYKHNLRMWAQVDISNIISLATDPAPLEENTCCRIKRAWLNRSDVWRSVRHMKLVSKHRQATVTLTITLQLPCTLASRYIDEVWVKEKNEEERSVGLSLESSVTVTTAAHA